MDSPAAVPAARLRHSKASAAELVDAHSCHERQYPRFLVVLSCRWAGPQPLLDTGGRGRAVPCLTTLYDIAIHWPTIS